MQIDIKKRLQDGIKPEELISDFIHQVNKANAEVKQEAVDKQAILDNAAAAMTEYLKYIVGIDNIEVADTKEILQNLKTEAKMLYYFL